LLPEVNEVYSLIKKKKKKKNSEFFFFCNFRLRENAVAKETIS